MLSWQQSRKRRAGPQAALGLVRSRAMPKSTPIHVELRGLTAAAKPTLLEALGDKRIAAILFLSFAPGLPFNLTNFSLQAWLAAEGLSIKTIGIFSLAARPYNIKFLWAPVLDRYLPPILGRRRGWILIYQACLAVCIGIIGYCSPTN